MSAKSARNSANPFVDFTDFTPANRFGSSANTPPAIQNENNPFRRAKAQRQVRPTSSSGPSTSSRVVPAASLQRSASTASPRPRTSHHRGDNNGYSPLAQLRHENRRAHRSHHLKKSSIPGPDIIDRLGNVLDTPFHHDGPYEATLASRQVRGYAPVDAVRESNLAALRATPRANIIDSLERHYPLQGTAMIPPGHEGPGGEIMSDYEEYDVMTRDGNYKRWPDRVYRDDDLKGKGEPTYSRDEFEKLQKASHRVDKQRRGRAKDDIELQPRARSNTDSATSAMDAYNLAPPASKLGRSESLGGKLKRHLGSLRRRNVAI